MLLLGLFVIDDAIRSGQDDEAELTRWEEIGSPFVNLVDANVETGRDDAALVQATVQLDAGSDNVRTREPHGEDCPQTL